MFHVVAVSDIKISQGSVETRLRYGATFYCRFAGNLLLSLRWKNFENRAAVGKVRGKRYWHVFFVGRQEEQQSGAVCCLEQGANDLHIVQLMPLPSSFIKIQIGLTFLVPAYPGCPGKEAVKRVSVYFEYNCLPVLSVLLCWFSRILN